MERTRQHRCKTMGRASTRLVILTTRVSEAETRISALARYRQVQQVQQNRACQLHTGRNCIVPYLCACACFQNIREQMAASLERMRELEEQVKAIPMLQVNTAAYNFTSPLCCVSPLRLTFQTKRVSSNRFKSTAHSFN